MRPRNRPFSVFPCTHTPRDLPPEEIANAAYRVLKQQISLPMDELIKETARLLGYQRTGANFEQAMRRGIQLTIRRNLAREQEGLVIAVG